MVISLCNTNAWWDHDLSPPQSPMHKCYGAPSLFPRVNETSSAALCFSSFSIRIERWMVVMESHYRARCPHNKSALRITMVGIAGGLLPLEPREQKKTKINIALLQHSLLLDTNVIPTPQGLISSLLYYWGVRKEKLDPATGGSKKNEHCWNTCITTVMETWELWRLVRHHNKVP